MNSKSRINFLKTTCLKIEEIPVWILLLIAGLLYLPLVFLGYSSDSDSYSVVRTGQYFVQTLDYLPSRLPGYFVHEVFVFFLNLIGGSIACNLGTLGMTLLMLGAFEDICTRLNVPSKNLLTLTLAIHPFVWANAAATIDYLWALGFAFFGISLLLRKRNLAAAITLGLAIGSRLSTVLLITFVFAYLLWKQKGNRKQLVLCGFFTALIAAILYLPALDFLEWDISRWLILSTGDPNLWTFSLRLGRFGYKNLMFWSLPAIIWMIVIVIFTFSHSRNQVKSWGDGVVGLSLLIILCYEILFYQAPIEMEYLLPTLPFVLIVFGKALRAQPEYLLIFFFLILIANFIWINPARSLTPNQTSEVVYGLWLEKGYLLKDISLRLSMLHP